MGKKRTALGCGCLVVLLVLTIVIAAVVLGPSTLPKPERGAKHPTADSGPNTPDVQPGMPGQHEPTKPPTAQHMPAPASLEPAAPGAAEQAHKPSEPAVTPQEALYLVYANAYRAAAARQGGRAPVLDLRDANSTLGLLPGRFRLTQVLGPSVLIADKVAGEFDETVYSVRVEGVSTSGQVDGAVIGFGSIVFIDQGPWSYVTVLGAKRTIHSVEALNQSLLQWAFNNIGRQQNERLSAARKAVEGLAAQLARLEDENTRVREYVTITKMIRMYERNLKNDPNVAALLEKQRPKLQALGEVTSEQVETYSAQRAQLQEELRQAKARLNRLGG